MDNSLTTSTRRSTNISLLAGVKRTEIHWKTRLDRGMDNRSAHENLMIIDTTGTNNTP